MKIAILNLGNRRNHICHRCRRRVQRGRQSQRESFQKIRSGQSPKACSTVSRGVSTSLANWIGHTISEDENGVSQVVLRSPRRASARFGEQVSAEQHGLNPKPMWVIDRNPAPLHSIDSSTGIASIDLLKVHLNDSEVRVEGLETLDYLDNMLHRERFTEQEDAITFESEVDRVYVSTPDTVGIVDHEEKRTFVIKKEGLPDVAPSYFCVSAHSKLGCPGSPLCKCIYVSDRVFTIGPLRTNSSSAPACTGHISPTFVSLPLFSALDRDDILQINALLKKKTDVNTRKKLIDIEPIDLLDVKWLQSIAKRVSMECSDLEKGI
ncbi:hypothetical protein DH2020_028939 [Rehmannia glutinosa]|uniref:Uncharacterized protein n=1 Tax=Rehmannia glutinosa TaxID=99300 RepID=A0ABR0VSQ2_REHGL